MANMNSAYRLYALFEKVKNSGGGTNTLAVWVQAFGIVEKDHFKQVFIVSSRLIQLNQEIDLFRAKAMELSFSMKTLSEIIPDIQQAISPLKLHQSWDHVRQHLTDKVLYGLSIFSEGLPEEETATSASDLAEVQSMVEELQLMVLDSKFDLRLKSIIEHHIQLIKVAMAEYTFSGSKSFRLAYQSALGEIIVNADLVNSNKDSPVLKKLLDLLDKTYKIVIIAEKTVANVEKIEQLGSKMKKIIDQYIGNG